jgi:hypothetical protein
LVFSAAIFVFCRSDLPDKSFTITCGIAPCLRCYDS